MVHPTCAPARHPDVPPAGDNPCSSPHPDSAALTTQATREINAVREAYHAATCIHGLVISAMVARTDEFLPNVTESRALISLMNSEFERRIQLARATIDTLMAAHARDA